MAHTINQSKNNDYRELSFRRATIDDCNLLYNWANDPLTRKNAHNKDFIQYEDHIEWFRNKLSSSDNWIFIITDGYTPVALIRLDRKYADLTLTYSVAPEVRGNGIGTRAISMLPDIIKTENIHCCGVTAYVYKSNIASSKIFMNAGYQVKENGELIIYRLELQTFPTILIATTKSWNVKQAKDMESYYGSERVRLITQKDELSMQLIDDISPKYIFFPHWSWIIPSEIFTKYCCIVFHMTDLPFGRGGSPLQNLISRGIQETQISALRVVDELDAGDIYTKHPLCLYGTAEEIFIRASKIVFNTMLPYILYSNITPQQQEGYVIKFARRTPEMSEICRNTTLEQWYDKIRMLDAEDYPQAFIRYGNLRLRFSRPKFTSSSIVADVVIEEDSHHE